MASMTTREQVKVVLIDTQYVVTDPRSFKSVVQNLTGKDSSVKWIGESSFSGTKRKRPATTPDNTRVEKSSGYNDNNGTSNNVVNGGATDIGDWRLPNAFSFKELDRLILPSMEEWLQLYAQ